MPRNYHTQRDAIMRRWYGGYPQPRGRRPQGPVTPADCLGIPIPVNLPFMALGHCLVWKHALNRYGYGVLTIGGNQELAHRRVFIQTRGEIPEGMQVNHLCNRPYCVQPAHLYAGTAQDNRDDSRIFRDPKLSLLPGLVHFPWHGQERDPLLQRLRERGTNWDVEPWEPVEQPPQLPLEEFTCPRHDFSITMQGGDCLICRICEISEFDVEMAEDRGAWLLVAELCPASQTVIPILEKVAGSGFMGESFREIRRRAYHRQDRAHWRGSHDLRSCQCPYCTQDRQAFRNAIRPSLTGEESDILDICDRLEPVITATLQEACAGMTVAWGMMLGMTGEHLGALWDHLGECPNSVSEQTRTQRTIESDFAYLLHALMEFQDLEEMGRDRGFRDVMLRWSNVRLREEDEERVFHTVLPTAEAMAEKLTLAMEREAEGWMKPFLESLPDFYQDIRWFAHVLAKKHVFELLRYELLGRNSSTEQRPHPHSGCAAGILETGNADPFPFDFQEGQGYARQQG